MRIPTHHAGEFSLALVSTDFANLRSPVVLFDDEVLVAESRDLSEVRDDDDLT